MCQCVRLLSPRPGSELGFVVMGGEGEVNVFPLSSPTSASSSCTRCFQTTRYHRAETSPTKEHHHNKRRDSTG